MGVRDELDRTVAGNELAQLVDRADLDMHTSRGEQRRVDVAGVRVGDRFVERLTVAVQRVERLLIRAQAGVRCRRRAPRPPRDPRRGAP